LLKASIVTAPTVGFALKSTVGVPIGVDDASSVHAATFIEPALFAAAVVPSAYSMSSVQPETVAVMLYVFHDASRTTRSPTSMPDGTATPMSPVAYCQVPPVRSAMLMSPSP
jgi:choline-glycine betaine transporter